MKLNLYIFCLLLLLFALALPLGAVETQARKTVIADGVGAGPEKAKARDDALQDAQRRAVEQGVGLYIDSETVVINNELISDTITRKTKGYVHAYKIVSENYNAGTDLYWVRIQAELSLDILEDDTDDLWERIKLGNNPRIMIPITAKDPDDEDAINNLVTDSLVKIGFKVFDDVTLNTARQKEAMKLVRDGHADAQDVMVLQDRFDYIVIGKFTVQPAKTTTEDPKTYSMKSSITARIMRTDTGQIIAAAPGEGAGAGFDEADALAASRKNAAENWLKKNLGMLVRMTVDPCNEFELKITGCTHETLMKIDDKLADLRFVRKADIVACDRGYAQLSVQYNGSLKNLAAHLAKSAGIPLQVESMTAHTIRAHVIK